MEAEQVDEHCGLCNPIERWSIVEMIYCIGFGLHVSQN